jgi:SNF2 family DNA or RNA helicase
MTTIELTSEWHKGMLARAVPGSYWDGVASSWVVDDPTPRAAAVILKLFPHLGLQHPELSALRDELLQDVRPFDNATPWVKANDVRLGAQRVRKVLEGLPVIDPHTREVVRNGWSLHEYQETDLAYGAAVLREHGAFYMGWERGLGKTLGTCLLIDELDQRSVLVVAPNTAKDSVWASELRRFCPWLVTIVLGNTPAKRRAALAAAKQCYRDGEPFALVVHYEALALIAGKSKTPSGKTRIGDGWAGLGFNVDLMVTDEDHRLSNPDSQMARAAAKVPHERLLILSGSIIQNHLEELYSPHHRAFPDRYTSRWRDWNDRFLDYAEGGYGKVCLGVKPSQVPALRTELGVWMVYRRKEDELDLPEKTYVDERIALSPAQRKAYDQLVDECMTQLDDGSTIKAQEGAAMMTKLRQVATGLDLVGGIADSTKLDRMVDIITDDEDNDFVVFSWYKAAVHAAAQRLEAKGIECFSVTGDTPHAKRAEMIARFQAGEGRVFIGTLATLGESVNLQRANNVIRLDRSFNPMLNVQAEDRVYRQGQGRPVTITDLISADTVDELHVLPILSNKEALRAAVLGGV